MLELKKDRYTSVGSRCRGLKTGISYAIVMPRPGLHNARWLALAVDQALQQTSAGSHLRLVTECSGLPDGTPAELQICDAASQRVLQTLQAHVRQGRICALWQHSHVEGIRSQAFRFVVRARHFNAQSADLQLTEDLWLELLDEDQQRPRAGAGYRLTCADGSERRGSLDAAGRAWVRGLPAGEVQVHFDALEVALVERQQPRPRAALAA